MVTGGLAVNAYVEPVVSLDLHIVVALDQLGKIKEIAKSVFRIEEHPYSVNLFSEDSELRIQIQTDPRYQKFIANCTPRKVLGYTMNVAALKDVLEGKIWAFSDESRRKSTRQKDLADIIRIVESYPDLIDILPDSIRKLVA